jgi:CheY-like chemotaxis protein
MKHLSSFVQQVMLVDDDPDACLLFERALLKVDAPLRFTAANSAEELMEDLQQIVPDILFLDLTLPGKSGLDCLEDIRRNARYNNMRVVVYSNSARMSDIRGSYERGANLFIVKPFSQSHLVNALEHVLRMDWSRVAESPVMYYINNQFVPFTSALTA